MASRGIKEATLASLSGPDGEAAEALGARLIKKRRVLCRPTVNMEAGLCDGYSFAKPKNPDDIEAIARAQIEGYTGAIDFQEYYSDKSVDEVKAGVDETLAFYALPGSHCHSVLAVDNASGHIAGVCLAGTSPVVPHSFANIADITVSPSHRGKGIGAAMIRYAINDAAAVSPAIKLTVTVGNSAESLYRSLGFAPGPTMSSFSVRL